MADPSTGALKPSSKLFHGGFHELTDEGLPNFIEEKYNQTLNKALWFAYDGMWRSMASGIGKGVAIAVATVMAGSAVIGGLATEATLAAGVQTGLNVGLGLLTFAPTALPILAIGAVAGAVYDYARRQDSVQKELAELRVMIRDYVGIQRERELAVDPNRVPGEGIEPLAPDMAAQAAPEQPVPDDYWQQRVAQNVGQSVARAGI